MAGSRFMIHNAMTIAFGNKSDMKKTYDLLESFDIELADEYSAKTKQDATLIAQWMNDETWFTAEKALEAGFVDKVNSNKQEPQAFKQWDLTAYSKAPAAQADEPLPEPAEPTPPIEPETKETEPAPELAENNLTNQTKVRQKQKLALLALH
jgi:ATP-dependent Clp protease protease subunit